MLVAQWTHSVSNPCPLMMIGFGRHTGSQSPTVGSQAFISYSYTYTHTHMYTYILYGETSYLLWVYHDIKVVKYSSASLDSGILIYRWYVELRHLPSICMWVSEIQAFFAVVVAPMQKLWVLWCVDGNPNFFEETGHRGVKPLTY